MRILAGVLRHATTASVICSVLIAVSTSAQSKPGGDGVKTVVKVLPLTLGQTVTGRIQTPAEQDRYTFEGVVGQRIYLDALTTADYSIMAQLRAPDGVTIVRQVNVSGASAGEAALLYLNQTGTYTLEVDGQGEAVGDYRFQVLDVASAPVLAAGGTAEGALAPLSGARIYRIAATAGQAVTLTSLRPELISTIYYTVWTPGNQGAGGQWAQYNLENLVLVSSGEHVLAVDSATEGDVPADYGLRMTVTDPTGTASGFGIVRQGEVAAGQTNFFDFTVPAGTWIYFDAQTAPSTSPVVAQLLDPDGNPLFETSVGTDTWLQARKSGAYRLACIGGSGGTFKFEMVNLMTGATPLVLGSTEARSMPNGLEADVFGFVATAGQQLYLDVMESDEDGVSGILFSPSGRVVHSFGASGNNDQLLPVIDEPGQYRLVLNGAAAEAADYRFRLVDWAQAPVSALPMGQTVVAELNPGFSAAWYRFNGVKGQRWFYDGSGSPTAYAYLYQPDGGTALGIGAGGDAEILLSQSGTFILALSGYAQEPTSVSFKVTLPGVTTVPLVLAEATGGVLSSAGEERRFTFTAEAGQTYYYDALDSDNDSISARLEGPGGQLVWEINSDTDHGPFVLSVPGKYTLRIGGLSDVLADFRFRLLDVQQAPVQPLGFNQIHEGTLDPSSMAQGFRFRGQAGQRLYCDSRVTAGSANWALIAPSGASLFWNGMASDSTVTLTEEGRYFLWVGNGSGTDPVPYRFEIVTPPVTTAPLSLNTAVRGSLARPGETHRYTFQGTMGQRLYYDALQSDADSVWVQLVDAEERVVFVNGDSDSNVSLFTLLRTGSYALVLGGYTDSPGDYAFRLLDLASAPLAGAGASGQLNRDGVLADDLYRVPLNGPSVVGLNSGAVSWQGGTWSLVGPNDEVVASATLGTDMVGSIQFAGDSAVVVSDPWDAFTVDYAFTIGLSAPVATSGLGIRQTGIVTGGTSPTFEFTAQAGVHLFLDSLDPASTATVEVMKPDGTAWFVTNTSTDQGPWPLPESGTYTVVLSGDEATFDFRFLGLPDNASLLTLGEVLSVEMESYETTAYRFRGSPGQRIYHDSRMSTSPSVGLFLYGPTGSWLWWGGAAYSDHGLLTLPDLGDYTLLVINYEGVPREATFLITDVAQAPVLALDQLVGGPVLFVPSSALQLQGSYFSMSFRDQASQDDWRVTQASFLTATRTDAAISFADREWQSQNSGYFSWGALASAGLTEGANGTDDDWENFSVQWDGTLTVSVPGTRLYLRSDDGSRLWIDVNHDGTFEESGPEFLDLNWGSGQSPTLSQASVGLPVGTYAIRMQYEEASGGNVAQLLWDSGASLGPRESRLFRFTAQAGDRVFADGSTPEGASASWWVRDPANGTPGGNGLSSDFEVLLTASGEYLVEMANNNDFGVSYGIRLVTPTTSTRPLTLGEVVTGFLSEAGEEHRFTFEGQPGQQLYYDALQADFQPVSAHLELPGGGQWFNNNADRDWVQVTLPQAGRYTLVLHNNADTAGGYRFRLLDVATQPLVSAYESTVVSGTADGTMASVFRVPLIRGLRLWAKPMSAGGNPNAVWFLYGADNNYFDWESYQSGLEALPRSDGEAVLVLTSENPAAITHSFQIIPGNHAPALGGLADSVFAEETTIRLTVTATDFEIDNDRLQFVATSLPVGASFDPASRTFTWTPGEEVGPLATSFSISVLDDGQPPMASGRTYPLLVNEINRAPVLDPIADVTVEEGSTVSFRARASDPDLPVNALAFSLAPGAPAGASINGATGEFAWTTVEADGPGVYAVTVVVTDTNPDAVNAQSMSDARTLQITVREVNQAPALGSIGNRSVDEQTELLVSLTIGDADLPANVLTLEALNVPEGAVFDPVARTLRWTPSEAQGPGRYAVTIRLTDSNPDAVNATSLSVSETVEIEVREVNRPPVLAAIGDRSVDELSEVQFVVTASDPDLPANGLGLSVEGLPPGASFDAASGQFRWTPSEDQGPGTYGLVFRVVDNGSPAQTTIQSMAIHVREVNALPVVTGIGDQTVTVGRTLTLQVVATDEDRPLQTLAYGMEEGPSGATVDGATGEFRWHPVLTDVGPARRVVVRVGDGVALASVSFSVTVQAPAAVRLTVVGFEAGAFKLQVDGEAGQTYVIEKADQLGDWTALATVPAVAASFVVSDPTPADGYRFYRVKLVL